MKKLVYALKVQRYAPLLFFKSVPRALHKMNLLQKEVVDRTFVRFLYTSCHASIQRILTSAAANFIARKRRTKQNAPEPNTGYTFPDDLYPKRR